MEIAFRTGPPPARLFLEIFLSLATNHSSLATSSHLKNRISHIFDLTQMSFSRLRAFAGGPAFQIAFSSFSIPCCNVFGAPGK
jgi:hypothetical protein